MIEVSTVRTALEQRLGGQVLGELPGGFTGAAIDSRRVTPGELFFALPGERTHGLSFVPDAVRRGATAAVVPANAVELAGRDCPLIVVPDGVAALQELARVHRERLHPRMIGVTGSVGKTSTKEAIASLLGMAGSVLRNEHNRNNEIGVPLSLLKLDDRHRYAVLEMAMDGRGQIALLASIVAPEVGVVTNVGPSHLERLGSLEEVALAKAELVDALPPTGTAVLNADDPRVRQMDARTTARVVTFGLAGDAIVRCDEIVSMGFDGVRFRLHFQDRSYRIHLASLGAHNVHNATAAAAVGFAEGLGWGAIIEGLERQEVQLRLLVIPGINGSTLLDDTYNASPASTLAALNVLADLEGRRIAVLGDMKELGSFEDEGHRLVGRRAAEVVHSLVVVGELGQIIGEEARAYGLARVRLAEDNATAVALLRDELQEGDVVLVKGSHSMQMQEIVAELRTR